MPEGIMGGIWDKNQEKREMRISRDQCSGLIIDMQERLFPHMDQKEEVLRKCLMLMEGLKVLELPLLITEQYPRGLGSSLQDVSLALGSSQAIEKTAFSCCDEPEFMNTLEKSTRSTLIIGGIEAHVCVMQTVIDLLEAGYSVVVVEDCVSSRNPDDKRVAMDRMRSEGAVIATCESILFELARTSGTEEFKAISRLVK
jgi:isochorismate hydrolase